MYGWKSLQFWKKEFDHFIRIPIYGEPSFFNMNFWRLSVISQQLVFFEKFHSNLENFHGKLEKFHSKLEKFHSKLEKFHSKLRKFHSILVKIMKFFSILDIIFNSFWHKF